MWDTFTPSMQIDGNTATALFIESGGDLWPTAKYAGRVEETAAATWLLNVNSVGSHSVRIGVIQVANTSALTGENWFSSANVGSALYVGGGIFSGSKKEKSPATAAMRSTFVDGDVVGIHVKGKELSFTKNGQAIPGSLRRVGAVQLAVQLCSPGDSVSVVSARGDFEIT